MNLHEAVMTLNVDNPKEIAKILVREGIKGNKDNCETCPLAKYFTKMTTNVVTVSVIQATEWGMISNDKWIKAIVGLPKVCTNFIHLFDTGHYPELDSANPFARGN